MKIFTFNISPRFTFHFSLSILLHRPEAGCTCAGEEPTQKTRSAELLAKHFTNKENTTLASETTTHNLQYGVMPIKNVCVLLYVRRPTSWCAAGTAGVNGRRLAAGWRCSPTQANLARLSKVERRAHVTVCECKQVRRLQAEHHSNGFFRCSLANNDKGMICVAVCDFDRVRWRRRSYK